MKMFTKSLVKKSVLLGGLAACLALGGAFDAGNVPDVLAVKQAHAEDVYAGTAQGGGNIYVMTHTIRWSGDKKFNVLTKSVRRSEYDVEGWEFVYTNGDWKYRLSESQSKNGLVPVNSPQYSVASSPVMGVVLNICLNN